MTCLGDDFGLYVLLHNGTIFLDISNFSNFYI